MKKKVIMILFFIILLSCDKEAAVVVEMIHFNISITDFQLKDGFVYDNGIMPQIPQHFGGGVVTVTNNSDTYVFNTQDTCIEHFVFSVPAGLYDVNVETPVASFYGQISPSFSAGLMNVEISDSTDTITVIAEPTCALVVVKDDKNQLEHGAFIIECPTLNNEDCISYPLNQDSAGKLYYTYILPDTVPGTPNAYVWLYGEEFGEEKKEGLHTEVFEIGFKYLIKVRE